MPYLLNKTFLSSLILSLTFVSCTTKKIDLLSKDTLYKQGLEYTKIKTIIKDNDVKGVLNITYLNPSYPNEFDNEYNEFLVGIYLDEFKKNYKLYLNDKRNFSQKLLDKNNKLYQNIPAFNPHSLYYIVKFKKEKSSKLIFNFSHTLYKNNEVEFKAF